MQAHASKASFWPALLAATGLYLLSVAGIFGVTYLYWQNALRPRLFSEARDYAQMLAQSQGPTIAVALEAPPEQVRRRLDAELARLLLLESAGTGRRLFGGVRLEIDAFGFELPTEMAEVTRGDVDCEACLANEVVVFSSRGDGIIALATLYSSPELANDIAAEFAAALRQQALIGLALLTVVWLALVALILSIHQARQRAVQANEAKSQFLANMSHELRTPLNAIIGFTQLLDHSTTLGPKDREQIRIIHQSGDYLLRLINRVLELSKIEAGRVTLDTSAFDLPNLIEGLDSLMGLRADRKGLRFTIRRPADLPRHVVGDEDKLRQILINLLGNAIKFTSEGGVSLEVSAEPLAPESAGGVPRVRLTFATGDTGPGIPPDELQRLFRPFQQTESGRVSGEGTGLGLAISQQFARLMGGSISVESRAGVGSTFTLRLPMALAEPSMVPVAPEASRILALEPECLAPEGGPWRILAVDDQPENIAVLQAHLERVGFTVQTARDGLEAVEAFLNWQPHLIWMDLRLPKLSGQEAMERIRAYNEADPTLRRPVIIALTAHAFEEERRDAIAQGFDDFLRKPWQETALFAQMETHLGVRFRRHARAEDESSALLSPPDETARWVRRLLEADRAALLEAAESCDLDRLEALLPSLRPTHPELCALLDGHAQAYAFDAIQRVLEPEGVR